MIQEAKSDALANSKVVIIGGTSGIGFATAKAAANLGAHVIIASGNSASVATALTLLPATVTGLTINVHDDEEVKQFFDQIGNFDHFVYTAGEKISLGKLSDRDISAFKESFNTRYFGAVRCTKYATQYIKKSIIFTSGTAGNRPGGSGWSLGASICSAMEGFTRAMSIELSPIRVNIVAPGIVKTPLWSEIDEATREGLYSLYAEKLPVKMVADAHDLAKTYIYLMQQNYATGQVVIVDGGGSLI